MSVKAMEWAAEAPLKGADKIVLLALAWHADDATGAAFPSQATLASWAGVSLRTVRDALARLEEDGWLVRTVRTRANGARTSDLFRLKPGREPERARKKRQPASVAASPGERRRGLDAGIETPPGERRRGSTERDSGAPTGERRRAVVLRTTERETTNPAPRVESIPAAPEPLIEVEATPKATPKRAKAKAPIPDDWGLTPSLVEYARARVPWSTPEAIAEHFKNWWQANGGSRANWDAAYRAWVNNQQGYGPPKGWTPPTAQVDNPVDDYERRVRGWLNRGGVSEGEWRAAQRDPDLMVVVLDRIGTPAPTR